MRSHVVAAFCTSAVSLLLISTVARAAEYTDLLDAADDFDDFKESTYDPFDFNIEPSFRFDIANAQIAREAPCVPNASDNVSNNPRVVVHPGRCDQPSMVYNREMAYKYTQSTVKLTLRAGLYKDLELRVKVPYVINASTGLKYDNESSIPDQQVNADNSSVDPSTARIQERAQNVFSAGDSYQQTIQKFDEFNMYRFFDLTKDYRYVERSGFADPSVGLFWAPFNDERDDTKATLLLGMEYTMPIAPIKRGQRHRRGPGQARAALEIGLLQAVRLGQPLLRHGVLPAHRRQRFAHP